MPTPMPEDAPSPVHERRTAWWLMAAFGAVVAMFLGSAEFVWHRAADIGTAAASIARDASPSIEHLAGARVLVEDVMARVSEIVATKETGRVDTTVLERDQRELNALMREYFALTLYPGERDLARTLDADITAFDRAVDELVERTRRGEDVGTYAIAAADLRRVHDGLAADLLQVIRFDAERALGLAREIERSRAHSRKILTLLESASTALAALVAGFAFRAKRRYEALLHAHQRNAEARADEQGQFAARVAHDIRSPLTTVGLSFDAIEREAGDGKTPQKAIERGRRALDRVVRIVDGLLDFARAGARPSIGAQAEVLPVLDDLLDELRPTADAAGVEIQMDRPRDLVVACNPGVLTSILANLLRNAIKYISASDVRRVNVRVIVHARRARFEVEDTGPGLPDSMRERIFDPYVRVAAASLPGIGLGLATVKRLCEGHGGRVGEEPAPGGGSCFWFELPRAAG